MSVKEPMKIDGMGIDGDTLVLMITDSLSWLIHGEEHLKMYQDKLNAYIRYIDEQSWLGVYRKRSFDSFRIIIYSKYPAPDYFTVFLDSAKDKLSRKHISITVETLKEG